MEQVIIFVGASFFTFTVVFEVVALLRDGWFIDKKTEEFVMGLDDSRVWISFFNRELRVHKSEVSICKRGSLLSKWYIEGLGSVPRWSRVHNKIEDLYFSALTNERGINKRA